MSGKKYSKGALKLMEVAEQLFGEHGIEGVSLRQIIAAAGQSNKSAIHHNFGAKPGLVQAVYDMRLPRLDEARQAKLDMLKDSQGGICARNLLTALYLPMVETFTLEEQNACSQFLLRLMHLDKDIHPFFQTTVPQPAALEIMTRLEQCYSHLPAQVFNIRLRLASSLSLEYIAERDRLLRSKNDPYPTEDVFWNEMVQSIEYLFQVPFPVTY